MVEDEPHETASPTIPEHARQNQRKPLGSRNQQHHQPAVVSGPLSMGPAAMARSSSRGTSSGSSSGIFSARSLSKTSSASNSALNSKPLCDSVTVEDEFGYEGTREIGSSVLKPVALSSTEKTSDQTFSPENDKLFLFQMPPVLPTLLNHSSATSTLVSSDLAEADKWPATAQGRYGKLRRYKSGRMVFILENGVQFLVSSSSEFGSEAQNTNVLAIDPEFGQSFNLGPVLQKFVCIPEFEKFQKI